MEQTQQETHQHHENQPQQVQQEDSSTGSSSKSSFLCRQSSTRWTPTTDQIRILKDLYYNNGVRSPSAEQIQRISARLRQYGKIEGKNVFYWFQNHKARERQKKRFSVDMAMHRGGVGWKPDDNSNILHQTIKYTSISPGVSGPSSPPPPNLLVGQMGNIGYGSVHMEKSFRDCSISPGCSGAGGTVSNNFGWVGVDPYTTTPYSYPMLDSIRPIQFFKEPSPEIETLPLFPMHGEDSVNTHQYNPNWFRSDKEITGSRTSLELTLNSYSNNKSI